MDYFSAIPSYPLRNFLQILCTVNFFLNDEKLDVSHYVTAVKMDEAKRLLEVTKKTSAEIAEVLGYSSQSYFQSVFKKSTGQTPGAYRGGI